jgi:hypothetical protein
MKERKIEEIAHYYTYYRKRKETHEFMEKLKAHGVKVFETKLFSETHEEIYYYDDLQGKYHIVVVRDGTPYTEFIMHADITADELASELENYLLPSELRRIVNAMLKIPKLELLATEMLLMGMV